MTPSQLSSLHTEITTDPVGIGYAAVTGQDQAQANLLNALTGPGAATITLASMPRDDFMRGITPGVIALASVSASLQSKWDRLLGIVRAATSVAVSASDIQALLGQMVTDGLMTQLQINTFTQRTGSRAEVIFGSGTVIRAIDVAQSFGRGL